MPKIPVNELLVWPRGEMTMNGRDSPCSSWFRL